MPYAVDAVRRNLLAISISTKPLGGYMRHLCANDARESVSA